MCLTAFSNRLLIVGGSMVLAACASSDVDKFSASTPETISTSIEVRQSDTTPSLYTFTGPPIDTRAGYGAFAKGMLRGGSNLGSAVSLSGSQQPDGQLSHRFVATLQYTNLGGVYREYDHAGIDGVENLRVEPVSRKKQYTPNGVIMTETLGVTIEDAALRSISSADLTLKLSNDSGNLETLDIPANYLRAYLLAVDRTLQPRSNQ